MAKRYVVELSESERTRLEALVLKGKVDARRHRHAQVLLKTDAGPAGAGWTDERAAEHVEMHVNTVAGIRKRFVNEGLDSALDRKKQSRLSRERVLDGAAEARLIAVSCGVAPEGRRRWTLRLLADRLVELEVVDRISYETVRQTLKKRIEAAS